MDRIFRNICNGLHHQPGEALIKEKLNSVLLSFHLTKRITCAMSPKRIVETEPMGASELFKICNFSDM